MGSDLQRDRDDQVRRTGSLLRNTALSHSLTTVMEARRRASSYDPDKTRFFLQLNDRGRPCQNLCSSGGSGDGDEATRGEEKNGRSSALLKKSRTIRPCRRPFASFPVPSLHGCRYSREIYRSLAARTVSRDKYYRKMKIPSAERG